MAKDWKEKYDQDVIDRVTNRDYSADAVTVKNDEDYAQILQNQKAWQLADEPGRASLHDQTEAIRAKYNYSGGDNGDKYIPIEKASSAPQPFTYTPGAASAAVDAYRGRLDALESAILNRDPFSYDYRTDPSWQSYKKQYTREGRRSSEDVMGQYAAMTGGMPSTAAVAAAQQAADYYNAKMTDMIPQLYQAAWDRYQDEGNQYLRNWNMLNTGYQAAVSQENADRNFQWNQYQDALDRAYQAERDAISDSRYADETAYSRGVYEDETQYSRDQSQLASDRQRILDYLAAGGTLEALQADSALGDLAERSGYSTAELTALRDQAARAEAQRQAELQASLYKAYNPSGKNPTTTDPEATELAPLISQLAAAVAAGDMTEGEALASIYDSSKGDAMYKNARDIFYTILDGQEQEDATPAAAPAETGPRVGEPSVKDGILTVTLPTTPAGETNVRTYDFTEMKERNFSRAMSSIFSMLDSGDAAGTERALTQIWPRLNADQKKRLREALDVRGLDLQIDE